MYCLASSRSKNKPVGTPMFHDGPIWTVPEFETGTRRGCRIIDNPSSHVKGRVMVDFEGFFSDSPVFRESISPYDSPVDFNSDDDSISHPGRMLRRMDTNMSIQRLDSFFDITSLSDEQLLTCPPLVPLYSFSVRQWCLAFIDDLYSIDWRSGILEELQIDEKIKAAIQGLVLGFSAHTSNFDDLVDGKGQGLVFLLHGPPGCGKTMTAESISESLKKPLYHLSGGELGTTAISIQRALETAFKLAERWDAILLLDEADSFLAKRDGISVERNSLIAIFLRLLEYQSGIIFLTTNRLEDFDSAFESRIHLHIPFSNLNTHRRELIWKRLAINGNCQLTEEQVKELGQIPLNGRQIKNILRMSSLFAAHKMGAPGNKSDVQGLSTDDSHEERVTMTFEDITRVLPLTNKNQEEIESIEQEGPGRRVSAARASLK
ncbi:P-loop containing nucleoside triphosphate hydrolase protein [Trichoderma pleuroticola]